MTYFEAGEWPVSYAGTGCSAFADNTPGAEFQDEFEQLAVNLLWNWSNRIFGTRQETIRPSRVVTPWIPTTFEGMGPAAAYYDLGSYSGFGWLPAYSNGSWLPLACGFCGLTACDHTSNQAIRLPGPVISVDKIMIDGAVLDPSKYRLDYGHTLIRQDGNDWPVDDPTAGVVAQNLILDTSQVGTWSITFTRGVEVPAGGQIAAGILACELYKAATEDPDCGLPSRVKSVTRQGISMEIVQTEFARATKGGSNNREAWTMIFPIDSWILSIVGTPREYVGVASVDTLARGRGRMGPWSGLTGR